MFCKVPYNSVLCHVCFASIKCPKYSPLDKLHEMWPVNCSEVILVLCSTQDLRKGPSIWLEVLLKTTSANRTRLRLSCAALKFSPPDPSGNFTKTSNSIAIRSKNPGKWGQCPYRVKSRNLYHGGPGQECLPYN